MGHFSFTVDTSLLLESKEKLAGLSESLRNRASDSLNTRAGISAAQWSGSASDLLREEMQGLGDNLKKFEKFFATAATTVNKALTDVQHALDQLPGLNRMWEDAQSAFANAQLAQGQQPASGSAVFVKGAEDPYDVRRTEELRLERIFNNARLDVEDAFRAASRTLAGAVLQTVPAAAVSAFVAGGGTGLSVSSYGSTLLPKDLNTADALAWEQPLLRIRLAKQRAAEAAQLVSRAAGGDEAAVQELKSKYGSLRTDPVFMRELMRELGAKGLLDAARGMVSRKLSSDRVTAEQLAVDGDNAWLTGYLGSGIALSTDPNSFVFMPEGYQQEVNDWRKKEFLPALVEAGAKTYTADLPQDWPHRGEIDADFSGHWAIGQFVSAGANYGLAPGPEFFTVVGGAMLRADKAFSENGSSIRYPGWAGPQYDRQPVGILGDTGRGRTSEDPVVLYLEASRASKATAQAFLGVDLDPASKKDGEAFGQSTIDYVLTQRYKDFPGQFMFDDRGQAFGQTVVLADTNRIDRGSTEIANEYVNVHAQGLAQEKGTQLAEREYVKQFSGMRYATAEVWAYHADDVREIVDREKSGGTEVLQDTATGEFHISLPQPAHLAIVIGDLSLADKDRTISASVQPSPLEIILAAHLASGQDRVGQEIRDTLPGERFADSGASREIQSQARIFGFVTGSAAEAWAGQGRSADEVKMKKQDLMQTGASLIYAPLELHPAGTLAKPVFDHLMKSIAKKEYATDSLGRQEGVNATNSFDLEARFAGMIDEQRRANLTWPEDKSPELWLKRITKDDPLQPQDERIFYTPDGKIKPILEGRARQAYEDWLEDDEYGMGTYMGSIDLEIGVHLGEGERISKKSYGSVTSQGLKEAPRAIA